MTEALWSAAVPLFPECRAKPTYLCYMVFSDTSWNVSAGWTTEQLREYIESGQLQPSLRLLGTNPQPKPVTAMTGAAEASWKAFQNACKHPDSMEVSMCLSLRPFCMNNDSWRG